MGSRSCGEVICWGTSWLGWGWGPRSLCCLGIVPWRLVSYGISGQGGQGCGLLEAPSPDRVAGHSPGVAAVSFPCALITSLQGWSWHCAAPGMHSPNNGPSSSSLPATHFPLGLKIKKAERRGRRHLVQGREQPTVGNTSAVVPLEIWHLRWEHQLTLAAPIGDNVLISGAFYLFRRAGKPLSSSCEGRLSPYCLLNWEQTCTCRCLSLLHPPQQLLFWPLVGIAACGTGMGCCENVSPLAGSHWRQLPATARGKHTLWVMKYWVFLHGCPMAPTHRHGECS